MKNVRSLKLNKLSEQELSNRELNSLRGGTNCCICGCGGFDTAAQDGGRNNDKGSENPAGGYGNGKYA